LLSNVYADGSAGGQAREAGFTLIEVLVVIAILGLAAAILVARGPLRSPGLEARAAASEVAQTLRLGRSRAIAADRPVAVVFDPRSHRLLLDGAIQPKLPAWLPVTAVMADGTKPRLVVFGFSPDGSATGGTVALGLPSRRILVAVDWLTGRVEIANGN
jgi:general secretion pathway protein H